jgi:MFS transporter, DHA2 family, methylenomycin A resistance protein
VQTETSNRTDAAQSEVPREAWLRLAGCAGAAALLQIDGTLITVALPAVGASLSVDANTLSWVLSAYFIAYALLLFPGGWLVDRFGSRRLAFWGLALFGAGALLGAISPSFGVLIFSRVVQGAGAGLVSPASLAGAVSGFPPHRRGSALGIWGASSGMANLLGPLLGGLLTVGFGWRADWWALVPLSIIVLATSWRLLPSDMHLERSLGSRDLGQRVVAAAAMVAGLTFMVMIGTFFIAQQYLQTVRGYSALGAGATLVFVALLVGLAAPLAGRLSDMRGARFPALVGFLSAGLGLAALGVPAVSLDGIASIILLVPVGLGLGLLFAPTSRAALNAVSQAAHGQVSAVLSAARLVGAAAGSGLGGVALASGVTTSNVHLALVGAAVLCVAVGMPLAATLGAHDAAPRDAANRSDGTS